MRSSEEIFEERERVWLCLQTVESKIRSFVRIYADDEYDLRDLIHQRDELVGRYEALKWVLKDVVKGTVPGTS